MVVINMKFTMKFAPKLTAVLLLTTLVTACESIPFLDTSSDYKGAGRSRPLEVPPDLTAVKSSDAYAVPGGSTSFSEFNQSIQGQEVGVEKVLANPDGVRMVKAGSQRWLVVDAPVERVWPVLREFWAEQGFAVRVEDPQVGLMETEWKEADAIKAQEEKGSYLKRFDKFLDKLSFEADRRKYRTRLENGSEPNTTEIYMSHRTVEGAPDNGLNVVRTPFGEYTTGYRNENQEEVKAKADDLEIDAELLRRLMIKLGIAESRAQEVVASAAVEKRADVVKEADSSVTLNLNDPFDRGWRRVGLALDRIGFVIEDKDRSNGTFFVRYTDVDIDNTPKKKKGVIDTLAFWRDDEEDKNADVKESKSLTEKLQFWKGDDGKTDPSKQYRIKVAESETGGTRVNVVDKDNKRSRTTTANRIISLMYEQLR